MAAFSERTQTRYDSWEDLVAAESNGYVVVAILTRGKKTWPWVEGPFVEKHEATKAQARLRYRIKRDRYSGLEAKVSVRPAWKGAQS